MTATQKRPNVDSTLDRLLHKVASVKAGSKGSENVPPTSHPTGDLDGGNMTPPKGPTATEMKSEVAEAAQSNPVDGSKIGEGDGDKEHGLRRMKAEDKPQVTPEMANKDPMKLASLSTKDLIAKSAKISTPVAAQLLVDAANSAANAAGAPAPTTTDTTKAAAVATPVATTPAVTATPEELAKAAKEGAVAAEKAAQQFLVATVKEASEAADLLAEFTKLNVETQAKLVKEAAKKKAEAEMPPPAAGGGAPLPPMADPAAGGGGAPMPPPGAGGDPMAGGGDPMAAAGGGGDPMAGGDPAAGSGAPGNMSNEQIEQLLMALLEQQGHADPKALEESADPGAQMMGKKAREFLKQGKFNVRAAKNAQDRASINQMKQFIRETAR